MQNQKQQPLSPAQAKPIVKSSAFTIGIIFNGYNADDIALFKEDLVYLNKAYPKSKLRFVVFGYTPADDAGKMLDGVEFEYVPPVSIIHWFKQVQATQIDLLFVPLIADVFNVTSENMNKYLEMAVLGIPLLAPNLWPYNNIVRDQWNGYLYAHADFKNCLINLLAQDIKTIKHCGMVAYKDVVDNYNFSPQNIGVLENALKTE